MGSRRFEIGLIAVYALLVYAMIPLHEPWRDEAQAWLIARDLDVPGVLQQMRYELSPPLWHLILWPFAHLGFPFETAHILNATAAVGSVAIFALASPFARWQKLVFAFCFLMAFEYGVVARSYGTSFLFGISLAALHPRRFERMGVYALLIVALGATNMHGLALAIALAVSLAWELARRPGAVSGLSGWRWGIAALAGAAGFAIWMLTSGVFENVLETASRIGFQGPERAAEIVAFGFLSPYPYTPVTAALGGAALLAALWQVRRNAAAAIVLVLPVALYTLSPLSRRLSSRHAGFVLLAALVALWIDRRTRVQPPAPAGASRWRRFVAASAGAGGIAVFGCLALTLPGTVEWIHGEVVGRSSAGRAMAHYIDENGVPDPIAARRASTASALLPYLPGRRFWFLDVGDWGTFVDWRVEVFGSRLSEGAMIRRIHERFPEERPWLLSSARLRRPERYGYELAHVEADLGEIQRGTEVYFLYRPRYW